MALGGDAVQRAEPLRVGACAATTAALTSRATSTSVVYAGTSRPYISDSDRANRARNCHGSTNGHA